MHTPVRRPLVGMALLFIAGIVLGEYCAIPPGWLWGVAAGLSLCALLSLIFSGPLWRVNVPVLLLVAAGGMAYQRATKKAPPPSDIRLTLARRPSFTKLRGIIVTPPEIERLDPILPDPLKAADPDTRTTFDLRTTAIRLGNQWQDATGRVRVRIYEETGALRYGDEIELSTSLKRPPRPTNPGQFDYAKFLARHGIFALANVGSRENVRVVSRDNGSWIKGKLFAFRRAAGTALTRHTTPQAQRLLYCMLLGHRRAVHGRLADAFVRSGTAHVLAISGLHLMILAGTLWWLLCMTPMDRRVNAVLVLVFVAFFVVVTGMRTSVQRAGIITAMMCLGEILNKRNDTINSLAAAAMLILLGNPNEIFMVGFQLTFGAVLGIVCFARPIDLFLFGEPSFIDRLAVAEERSPVREWLGRYGRANISVSCAAMLATAPLVASSFHVFTPMAIVLNLLIFPFLWIIISLGTVAIFVGQVCGPLGWPLAQCINCAAFLFERTILLAEKVRFAYAYLPGPSGVWLVAYYGVLVIAACRVIVPMRRVYIWTLMAALFIAPAAFRAAAGPPGHLCVTCLDVGHGAAFFVEFPSGRNLLYDAGTARRYDVGRSVVAPFLWSRGIRRLDALVISHAHADHYNGIPSLCDRFGIDTVLIGRGFSERPVPGWIVDALRSHGANVVPVAAGDRVEGYGECVVDLLHPPDSPILDALAPNNRSCVLRIRWRDLCFLLTGDIESRAARMIQHNFPGLQVEVVQLPHHGRMSSSVRDFVLGLSPEAALVNADEKDISPVVQRLAYQGVRVYATPETGAVTVLSDKTGRMDIMTFLASEVSPP